MTWIVEEPLYILILGVVAVAMLGFALLQTGWRWLLYTVLGVIGVTALLLLVERWVETDAERVEATLHDIARRVEDNDLEGVLEYLTLQSPAVRAQARAEFPKYRFDRVSIKRNLEVVVDDDQVPPTATATFNVVVTGAETSFGGNFHVARFVEVTLVKKDDRWLVDSYQHSDPRVGLQR